MMHLDTIKERLSAFLPMWLMIMLVAIWSVVIQDGHINNDGLLYLKQAYLIAEGSWKEGLALYPWPFFSILIAIFHKITGLHLQVVAHAVDLVLFGIAAWFYLKTVKLIYQHKYIVFYAGLLLLSFIPIMDDYVGMVLRDHGLWAGCMMGTFFYLKYINHNFSIGYNLLWQFSFLLAGAFRPEGLVLLVLTPLFNIFFIQYNDREKYSLKSIFNQFIFLILGCLCFVVLKNLTADSSVSIQSAGRLNEFVPRIISFFKQLSSPLLIFTDNEIFNLLLKKYPVFITITLLGSLFLKKIISGLGLLNIILIFSHLQKGSKINRLHLQSIYFFIIISVSLVFVLFFNNFVLTDRYFILSHIWILIVLAPVFHSFFEVDLNTGNKLRNFLVCFLVVICLANVFIDSKSKSIEIEAGEFLKGLQLNNEVTLINSERIAYFAGFSIQQIMNLSKNIPDNQDWLVVYGKNKLSLPLGYDIYHRVDRKDQAVFFLKKT